MVDLKILFLGISKDGNFDEKDIEKSDLKKLGVGRILDQLGSLKERNLIEINKDGSFSITNSAKHILWDKKIPLWVRILRVLEIKSQNIDNISSFLLVPQDKIKEEIEDLRKRHVVLMSPLRNETKLEKFYEILPEGIELIEKGQSEGFQNPPEIKNSQIEIFSIIDQTIKEIKSLEEISDDKKQRIISNLLKIKERLEI
ncbi:MAG: hypothetical protein PVI88_02680 [Nitrosopumilaceae archaeon]